MGQYIPNISLARYFNMITQAAARARSDVSVLELQRLKPLDVWAKIDLGDIDSLDDLLHGKKQFHIVVRVPLSGEQDLVQSVQAFHYWQMYVPCTRRRRTWVEIITTVQNPKFDRRGKLLNAHDHVGD